LFQASWESLLSRPPLRRPSPLDNHGYTPDPRPGGPGAPYGGACAIVGLQSCIWNTFNQNFLASLLLYLADLGVTDASLYGTEIVGACAPVYPDNSQSNDVFAAVTIAMQNRQYSLTSTRLSAILSGWNATSLAGGKITGVSLTGQ